MWVEEPLTVRVSPTMNRLISVTCCGVDERIEWHKSLQNVLPCLGWPAQENQQQRRYIRTANVIWCTYKLGQVMVHTYNFGT